MIKVKKKNQKSCEGFFYQENPLFDPSKNTKRKSQCELVVSLNERNKKRKLEDIADYKESKKTLGEKWNDSMNSLGKNMNYLYNLGKRRILPGEKPLPGKNFRTTVY